MCEWLILVWCIQVLVPERTSTPANVLRVLGGAPLLFRRPRRPRRPRGCRGISPILWSGRCQVLGEGVRGGVRGIGRGVVRRMQERDDCVGHACQVTALKMTSCDVTALRPLDWVILHYQTWSWIAKSCICNLFHLVFITIFWRLQRTKMWRFSIAHIGYPMRKNRLERAFHWDEYNFFSLFVFQSNDNTYISMGKNYLPEIGHWW